MGFAGTTQWDVQAGGSDTANGGGFDAGNANMATDLAATSATGASPVVTSASYNFVARDNGAWLFIKSGTNWTPGWYQIASTSGNAATLAAGVGAAVGWNGTWATGPSTAAGCATTASPTSGTWSIDYSQGTSPIAFTDMVIDGTTNTKVTSALTPFGKNFVGNVIAVTSGTGFTVQRVQVSSVTGTAATVDKTLGTLSSTGGNGGLGGCLASPGLGASLIVAGNVVHVQSGTYTIGSGTGAGNTLSPTTTYHVIGYGSLRGDRGTRPVLQAGANSITIITLDYSATSFVENITCTGNGHTSVTGFSLKNGKTTASLCKASGCAVGFTTSSVCQMVACEADTCGTGFTGTAGNGAILIGCTAHNCTTAGFVDPNLNMNFIECVAWANAGAGFSSGTDGTVINCISDGNTTPGTGLGFNATNPNVTYLNCRATNNGGNGFDRADTVLYTCAGYGNAANLAVTPRINSGFITLTADPSTNAAAADFTLNATAGGGALLRGLGWPTTFPGLSPTNYPSVGAYQPDPAGAPAGPSYFAR